MDMEIRMWDKTADKSLKNIWKADTATIQFTLQEILKIPGRWNVMNSAVHIKQSLAVIVMAGLNIYRLYIAYTAEEAYRWNIAAEGGFKKLSFGQPGQEKERKQ